MALRLACAASVAAASAGCIEDDRHNCLTTRSVVVRAFDNAGAELGPDEVEDVQLWVFDQRLRLVETIPARVGERVAVTTATGHDLHLVAWGNLGSGMQRVNAAGVCKGEHCVELLPDPLHAGGHASPGYLFHGALPVSGVTAKENTRAIVQDGTITLPVHCAVGSMTVTLRDIPGLEGREDDRYHVVVRETVSSIDFYGRAGGGPAAYSPGWSFRNGPDGSELFVPAFNLIPGEGATIEIYRDGELAFVITGDGHGNPIVVERGLMTNVLVDGDRAVLDVRVSLTPWGSYELWKEF